MSCNHLLGHIDNDDYISLFHRSIKDELKPWCQIYGLNITDILDHPPMGQKLVSRFKYCPYCGEMIEWDDIRKELQE